MEHYTSGLTLTAHSDYSYVPRTIENAKTSGLTIALAKNFNSKGEVLTKRAAGENYLAIPFGDDPRVAGSKIADAMRSRSATCLNVAGNSAATFDEFDITQVMVNAWVFEVLKVAHNQYPISFIQSGGQTGADQAGLVAAIALGISAKGLYPAGFRRRSALGIDFNSTANGLIEELENQAKALMSKLRKFHRDGELPSDGQIFVFGSNLAGRHGKGAALIAAKKFGAVRWQGQGLMSNCYAIPTKDGRPGTPPLQDVRATLPLSDIKGHVETFIEVARVNSNKEFFITRLGCSLAAHHDQDIAPLFANAPSNCSFPDVWAPWLRDIKSSGETAVPINIFSGTKGLGGALTNMTELAKERGCIKHSYPVLINEVTYPDAEYAYQRLKIPGNDEYNDGLMIDIIALKLMQHKKLFSYIKEYGGAAWIAKCSHFTSAKSERFQAWEGQGLSSRFIRNLYFGYIKAETGQGPRTRVVHVSHAPYDIYIGRDMLLKNPKYKDVGYGNHTIKDGLATDRSSALKMFSALLEQDPIKKAQAQALRGKTLGCWCKTPDAYDTPCHGEIWAAAAEDGVWVPQEPVQKSLFDF